MTKQKFMLLACYALLLPQATFAATEEGQDVRTRASNTRGSQGFVT